MAKIRCVIGICIFENHQLITIEHKIENTAMKDVSFRYQIKITGLPHSKKNLTRSR